MKPTILFHLEWRQQPLRYKGKEYVLDQNLPLLDDDSSEEEMAAYNKHYDESMKVACIKLATMSSELQKSFESLGAFDINENLKEMFEEQDWKE